MIDSVGVREGRPSMPGGHEFYYARSRSRGEVHETRNARYGRGLSPSKIDRSAKDDGVRREKNPHEAEPD